MKIKQDFVTNSSSSSFIVKLEDITALQYMQLLDHYKTAENMKILEEYAGEMDKWRIVVDGENLVGDTYMDNFNMQSFMEKIGVDLNKVTFDD